MPAYSYRTLSAAVEGIYKEKGSKFLSFAYPVSSESEIKEKIDVLKKKYFDARHHCYAWMLGAERLKYRAFDDGEPNHSAGDPILGTIRSAEITNVLIVVVRYFGGVKLGVGGLINAYKTAALDALSKAQIVEENVTVSLRLRFAYDLTSTVMKVIKDLNLTILDQTFDDDTKMHLQVSLQQKENLFQRLELIKATEMGIAWKFES